MRTFLRQNSNSQSSNSARLPHISAMSPATLVSFITTAALLVLTAPGCKSAPAEVAEVTTDPRQLLSQINAVCSSYLLAEDKFWVSTDPLAKLCVLMLVQKSKELKTRESKRAELQGPGGIQSRGYFLYRPRNGRRSLDQASAPLLLLLGFPLKHALLRDKCHVFTVVAAVYLICKQNWKENRCFFREHLDKPLASSVRCHKCLPQD
ncbi:hypothetical protein WMY93_025160 [Mugilogobius chulae]|uniref:Neuromedin U C-terminal domain-containing protein n=1 Tax=Mugilogobius chulae TaxID=88201 RepID=A0AAW0N1L6_9GOBI